MGVEQCLALMKEEGLQRDRDFKVWLMAEIPSIVFMADEFSMLCDGFSIGSNDLTQLTLGVDRDSPILPSQDQRYFDERDPAVMRAMVHLIRVAHEHGVTVSICGQGPSVYPEMSEMLVRAGIDSVSANPDMVIWTRKVVAGVERKVIMERFPSRCQQINGQDWTFSAWQAARCPAPRSLYFPLSPDSAARVPASHLLSFGCGASALSSFHYVPSTALLPRTR
jgi:pyruvate,water dikinase